MGVLDFIFSLIVLVTLGGVGLAYVAGRMVFKAGRRVLGWAHEQKLLPGERQGRSREARDVVVEPVDEADPYAGMASETPEQADYVRLSFEDGTTPEEVIRVMRSYMSDQVLGERAHSVIATLKSRERRRQMLEAELDAAFQRGSISWEKFSVPVRQALDALLRSAILLANRIQGFDTPAYLRLFKSVQRDSTGAHTEGATERAERLQRYQDMLDALDRMQETNEDLLLELDRLSNELGTLSQAEGSEQGEAILNEIRRLVDETRYYR